MRKSPQSNSAKRKCHSASFSSGLAGPERATEEIEVAKVVEELTRRGATLHLRRLSYVPIFRGTSHPAVYRRFWNRESL